MTSCAVCLGSLQDDTEYHPECIQSLFGVTALPDIQVELSTLYKLAATRMAGKMSISGAQEKVSLALSSDKSALEVTASGGRYILKPESSRFSEIPQNEQLSMRLASIVSIEVPAFGLIRLRDERPAYIIKRFDRLDDGTKLQVEDFCQLSEKPMRDKYDGSAELCVKVLRKYATEPLIEIQKFYQLLLFSWWIGNGDMHLKNFSLITAEGFHRLSPAYDLVCTKLVIPDDRLALSIGGRDRKLTRQNWTDFAVYCALPERAAKRLISNQIEALESSLQLISASFLSNELKQDYEGIVRQNKTVLSG